MEYLKLLFIRHAESVGNVQQRMQGHGEFELSVLGQQQADQLGRRLWAKWGEPTQIYTSPLKRAVQTVERVVALEPAALLTASAARNYQITDADDLKEFQNGIFAGLTWAEARSQHPTLCAALEASPDWIAVPEAESLQDAWDRAQRFIHHLLIQHRSGETIWIITHSWILQHLVASLMGCDRTWQIAPHHTAIFEFWIERSRWQTTDHNRLNSELWQIRRFNDDQHLDHRLRPEQEQNNGGEVSSEQDREQIGEASDLSRY